MRIEWSRGRHDEWKIMHGFNNGHSDEFLEGAWAMLKMNDQTFDYRLIVGGNEIDRCNGGGVNSRGYMPKFALSNN